MNLLTRLLIYLCCIKIFHEVTNSTAHVRGALHISLAGLSRVLLGSDALDLKILLGSSPALWRKDCVKSKSCRLWTGCSLMDWIADNGRQGM